MRALDTRLLGDMARSYTAVFKELQTQLDALTAKIARARAVGEEIPPSWLYREGRLTELRKQVVEKLQQFGQTAAKDVQATRRRAIALAQSHASDLAQLASPSSAARVPYSDLPAKAVEKLVNGTKSGVPLTRTLKKYSAQAAAQMERALVTGLALGYSPQRIAREARGSLKGGLSPYLRLARTETMHAYTSANIESYRENADILEGWEWMAAGDELQCPYCSEKDGNVFPLDEDFESHPMCRCSPSPVVRS